MRKYIAAILAIVIASHVLLMQPQLVQGEESLEEQLQTVEDELARIRDEKAGIQEQIDQKTYVIDGYNAQASELYGEVQIFQRDIEVLQLEIQELEINIELLEDRIAENIMEIEKSEKAIQELDNETQSRIKGSYRDFRLNGDGSIDGTNLFNASSMNRYFRDTKYIGVIQDDTNSLLIEIAELKDQLNTKKQELEDQLLLIEKEKAEVEVRRSDLDKQQAELEVRMNQYYAQVNSLRSELDQANQAILAISQEEVSKRTESERLQAAIFNSFTPPSSGEYVTTGRPIGNQGCTGLCTGDHLHFSVQVNGAWQDPCGYLKSGGPVSGCGWGNALNWPISGGVLFTSAFGNRCFQWNGTYCDYHTGADFAGAANTPIYAAHDGYLHYGVDQFGAQYAIICENTNCNSGIKTGYWHLQYL